MKCVTVFENSIRESWDVHAGMHQDNLLNRFDHDDRDAAVAFAKENADSTVMVCETGSLAGYDEKYVAKGLRWEQA